eukprot:TRINITY_DN4778_c0_g1_i4.p1 TRINITY_DN4778_c0_g1~~TRINITY_DN4778_c0_g1_i4.p1  ORF type:complete len:202 (-),score=57.17 TRINITY_DN4778_c0_g1_i4:30-635(-)
MNGLDVFFFFSSRRRHTRCREVSWARRCVQETGINAEYMGLLSYLSWWSQRLIEVLLKSEREEITIADLSRETSIKISDIIMVLERLNILRYHQGQHVLFTERKYLEDLYKLAGHAPITVEKECLHWTPYIHYTNKTTQIFYRNIFVTVLRICLLYTSDAADDTPCVDLGGRRIIKKKNSNNHSQQYMHESPYKKWLPDTS